MRFLDRAQAATLFLGGSALLWGCSQPPSVAENSERRGLSVERRLSLESLRPSLEPQDAFQPTVKFNYQGQYRSSAELQRLDEPTTFTVRTLDGHERGLVQIGSVRFFVDGREFVLPAVTDGQANVPFALIMFRDQTNGRETSHLGRYVNVPLVAEAKSVELDFNTSYHPPCYYNPKLDCPVPPESSSIDIRVEAGERLQR